MIAWMIERKAKGNQPPMWWAAGAWSLTEDPGWTAAPNCAVKFADAGSATATLIALMWRDGIKGEERRKRFLERVGITEHEWPASDHPSNVEGKK